MTASTTRIRDSVPWLVYPGVMLGCIGLHAAMLGTGFGLAAATLTPVLAGTAFLTE